MNGVKPRKIEQGLVKYLLNEVVKASEGVPIGGAILVTHHADGNFRMSTNIPDPGHVLALLSASSREVEKVALKARLAALGEGTDGTLVPLGADVPEDDTPPSVVPPHGDDGPHLSEDALEAAEAQAENENNTYPDTEEDFK